MPSSAHKGTDRPRVVHAEQLLCHIPSHARVVLPLSTVSMRPAKLAATSCSLSSREPLHLPSSSWWRRRRSAAAIGACVCRAATTSSSSPVIISRHVPSGACPLGTPCTEQTAHTCDEAGEGVSGQQCTVSLSSPAVAQEEESFQLIGRGSLAPPHSHRRACMKGILGQAVRATRAAASTCP